MAQVLQVLHNIINVGPFKNLLLSFKIKTLQNVIVIFNRKLLSDFSSLCHHLETINYVFNYHKLC